VGKGASKFPTRVLLKTSWGKRCPAPQRIGGQAARITQQRAKRRGFNRGGKGTAELEPPSSKEKQKRRKEVLESLFKQKRRRHRQPPCGRAAQEIDLKKNNYIIEKREGDQREDSGKNPLWGGKKEPALC